MFLWLRNTTSRGRSAVPRIFLRIRIRRRARLSLRCFELFFILTPIVLSIANPVGRAHVNA